MSSRNTRIDVEVNTQRARDNIRQLADDVARVNNTISQPSSSTQTADYLRKQQQDEAKRIRREFEDLRNRNNQEYRQHQTDFAAGRISENEFSDIQRRYLETQSSSFDDERAELLDSQNRTNELLQRLVDNSDNEAKQDAVANQRDNSETQKSGIIRSLFEKRAELIDRRNNAQSEGEINDINKELREVNKSITKRIGGDGSNIASTITGAGQTTQGIMHSGDLVSGGMNLLSKAGPWGMAAAAIIGTVVAGVNLANKRDEEISNLTSYRALGDRSIIDAELRNNNEIVEHGYDSGQYINKRAELLKASGRYQSASQENTMNVIRLERGYGIENISEMSRFERQDSKGNMTSDNILKMLNVLTEIKNSGIDANNFTLANEKAQTFGHLYGDFASRQNKVDADNVIRTMAAFNSLGGAGSDHRATDFISGTLNAMREGGNDNMMALKYQFASQVLPGGSQADIARMVEEGTDPRYMKQVLSGLSKMFGGNKDAEYFGFKEFFGTNLTADMRKQLLEAGASQDFLNKLSGRGLGEGTTASYANADEYSKDKTNLTDSIWGDVKKDIADIASTVKDWFRQSTGKTGPQHSNLNATSATSNKVN